MRLISIYLVLLFSSFAADAVNIPRMSMDLAVELAKKSVDTCRQNGYWVSAVVVDRSANVQVVIRDTYAARFTINIARKKANLAIMGGMGTGEFIQRRNDIKQELNSMEELVMLRGALLVKSGETILGAIGVSGAPGGEKDEACASKALQLLKERLSFAAMSLEE